MENGYKMKFDLKLKLISRLSGESLFLALQEYDVFLNTAEIDAICKLSNFPECMNLIVQRNPRAALKIFKQYLTTEHRFNLKQRGYDDERRHYWGS